MSKDIIVVTAAYSTQAVKQLGGQQALLNIIQGASADGVEIRQELLLPNDRLADISNQLKSRQLTAVYSVPDTLFQQREPIIISKLQGYFDEAKQLNARFLKLSLGEPPENYDLSEVINVINRYTTQLVIENDQTETGGHIAPLERFFRGVAAQNIPIKMAFDMANWYWQHEDPLKAAHIFTKQVAYIHVKACQLRTDKHVAVALDDSDGSWEEVLQILPNNVPRGIEFPLEGHDLRAITEHYVSLLKGV
ncbi:TIM barrel protein [Providencia rettgeri]|uniref:sugar phosphate isomerase/epimerase family protein n=1 Tax=Providencia rettgeri TaxID=587 RepID=UPI0005B3FA35|nr:TIM barrel protein [Providencia rettgeri]EJD6042053.1 TIM barrel protein [Providencia rettgeri]ELR5124899.1 TIM barrel protein [Providencia rettgeri]ELR5245811.1 TIM barrel protein [Providencia rettgeri]ELS4583090.1 TIM barrel protein [Providencia rettgeri]